MKTWKLWLFSSACFLFVAIMDLIDKKYLMGSLFILLTVAYICLSITNYKKESKK